MQEVTSQVLLQLVAAYQLPSVVAVAHIPTMAALRAAAVILDLLRAPMVARGATITAQPAVMEEAAAVQPQAMALAAVFLVKEIPAHLEAIIGQAMAVVAHPGQGLVCKVDQALLAQSLALVYLEQVVEVAAETHQSIVAMATVAAVEATAVLQIGATAIIHIVKILAGDGELLMHIVPILDQAVAPAHTGPQTSAGMQAAAMVPVA